MIGKPGARPRLSLAEVMTRVAPLGLTARDKLFVVGIRGYYLDTQGKPGVNDRGIYDDAIFIVAPGIDFRAFNGNTDPSRTRLGTGTGAAKGMACLKPGLWRAHRFGMRGEGENACRADAEDECAQFHRIPPHEK